mmetsp:Transcript_109229/g.216924  ORF Transcript_109229/g.216924 Transcript_109229/m.216924 type:complete len:119 (+) Transcript_109229:46-402(+)
MSYSSGLFACHEDPSLAAFTCCCFCCGTATVYATADGPGGFCPGCIGGLTGVGHVVIMACCVPKIVEDESMVMAGAKSIIPCTALCYLCQVLREINHLRETGAIQSKGLETVVGSRQQ